MPVTTIDDRLVWQRRTPLAQWAIWAGWLALAVLFVLCWEVMNKNTMWMFPGAEPMKSESTARITPMMDGRFIQCEMSGDMPGMGPYHGFGINGFDNVSQKFVSIWIDNHSTGIMSGAGKLSPDGQFFYGTNGYRAPCFVMVDLADLGPELMELPFGVNPPSW